MNGYKEIYARIKKNWDSIAKPLDSLGKLEDIVCKIGAVQNTVHPRVDKSAVLVLCADNGIVEEGVSQSDQSVTALCTRNIAEKKTTVGIMAAQSNTDVIAVDMGVALDLDCPLVVDKKIRRGTRNFAKESAMTQEEVFKALETGKLLVKDCKEKGYEILCIGEMGIGNTTTSAAVASSMLKKDPEYLTGRGAGLSNEGLKKKIAVIKAAIERYRLYDKSPIEILQYVGGLDIAGMVGVYLGAKEYGIPVVMDGAISMTAALVAINMDEEVKDYLVASHKSREPLVQEIIKNTGFDPVLDAGMALGEGTGAVLMMQVIKTAVAVYEKSVPFTKSGVEQYTRQN